MDYTAGHDEETFPFVLRTKSESGKNHQTRDVQQRAGSARSRYRTFQGILMNIIYYTYMVIRHCYGFHRLNCNENHRPPPQKLEP